MYIFFYVLNSFIQQKLENHYAEVNLDFTKAYSGQAKVPTIHVTGRYSRSPTQYGISL